MVFPGKLSNGCARCKQRKLKCDESLPECRRCVKYGKPCPGYTGASLSFRSENDRLDRHFSAAAAAASSPAKGGAAAAALPTRPAAQSPRGVSSPTTNDASARPTGSCTDLLPPSREFALHASLQLDPTWEAESLGFFVDQHVIAERGCSPGHLQVIPQLYQVSDEASCFRPALKAVAYLTFARQTRSPKIETLAVKWYQQALMTTRHQLEDIEGTDPNQMVAAVMLLNMFDDIEGTRCGAMHHITGLVHILKARKGRVKNTSLSGWVFHELLIHSFTTFGQAIDPLVLGLQLPADRHDGGMFIASNLTSYSRTAKKACNNFTRHCASLGTPIDASASPELTAAKTALWDTILQALSTRAATLQWAEAANAMQQQSQAVHGFDIYGTASQAAFPSQLAGCSAMLMLAAMIVFNADVITCVVKFLAFSTTDQEREEAERARATSLQAIKYLLRRVSETAPYCLGEVDSKGRVIEEPKYRSVYGYLLVWPLAAVARCKLSTPEQSVWADNALQRIGERMGLSLAFWTRDQMESPFPEIFR